MPVGDRLAERIRRRGPIRFDEYVEAALYDPEGGYFTGEGRGAGRARGDFVTSPEVGALYGVLVGRALDRWWRALAEPDPFVVVDAGAGRGRLAADVLRASPECVGALRLVLVERSSRLRAEQRELLDLEPPERALGPVERSSEGEADAVVPVRGLGPIATALPDLPAVPFAGVVVANELLDNLPFVVVERAGAGWSEVRVGSGGSEVLGEVLVPAEPAVALEADRVAAGYPVPRGARLPLPCGAAEWLERCAGVLRRGTLVVVDYAATARDLGERGQDGWLRTYRGHERGGPVLGSPGEQDVTCDLPLEYLLEAAARAGFTLVEHTDQAAWLQALGVEELADHAAAAWRGRAEPDLGAIAARSRVHEADALTDPAGLGGHHVLVWTRT